MFMVAVDAAVAKTVRALREAGVQPLLLKGPSVERWLYRPEEMRISSDVDLLVDPRRLAPAERRLKREGLVNRYDGISPAEALEHADTWSGPATAIPVDLHRRLWGFESSAEQVWERLWVGRGSMTIAGEECAVLGEPARALAVALHAAHHVDLARPIADLARALQVLDDAVWTQAAELAVELEATTGLRAGLGLVEEGGPLLARLGWEPADPADVALRSPEWDTPRTTEGLLRLSRTPGAGGKAALIARELFPSRQFMRTRSDQAFLARRGRRGLVAAYPFRWVRLLISVPRGIGPARRLGRD